MKSKMIITFEGIDGAGKTTLVSNYHEYLTSQGVKSQIIKFPTCQEIRDLVGKFTSRRARIMLFMADITNTIENIINKDTENTVFLVDRFFDSTYIYQVASAIEVVANEELTILAQEFFNLKQVARQGVIPEFTVFIDAAHQVCMGRIKERGVTSDDQESTEQLQKLEIAYRGCYQSVSSGGWFNSRVVTINGNLDEKTCLNELTKTLSAKLIQEENDNG